MGARRDRSWRSGTNDEKPAASAALTSSCSPLGLRLSSGWGVPLPGDSTLSSTHIAQDDVPGEQAGQGRSDRQDSRGHRGGSPDWGGWPRTAHLLLFRSPASIQRACGNAIADMARSKGRVPLLGCVGALVLFCVSGYAADAPCAACHPTQVEGYLETGMGRSLSRLYNQPDGAFSHEFSETRFTVASSGTGMLQRVERDGWHSEQRVEFVIGSGNHAFGYLIARGRHLFQPPISYYARRGMWDVAPGYGGEL